MTERSQKLPFSPAQLEGLRVLIVEDNHMSQRLAVFMLKGLGLRCDACGNGEAAIEMLKQHTYDLVLMDLEMPVLNGDETTQKIRKELKLEIPVIAMTAHDSKEELEKCRKAGMNAHVTKPLDEETLLELLAEHIRSTGVRS
jgi:CheY-like chemotaxis protein